MNKGLPSVIIQQQQCLCESQEITTSHNICEPRHLYCAVTGTEPLGWLFIDELSPLFFTIVIASEKRFGMRR
jgi:hypothetical protein